MPGDEISLAFTKWGGGAHWIVPTRYLGTDEHGTWLGCVAGTRVHRPGVEFALEHASVVCVPDAQHWVATVYDVAEPGHVQVYVDITTPATWSAGTVTMIDLDLDVVLPYCGTAYIDDEDEFAVHRLRYGYPPGVVAAAERTGALVLDAVQARRPPFDPATAHAWFEVLAQR